MCCDGVLYSASIGRCWSSSSGLSPNRFIGVNKTVCPSLPSLPPAISPDLRVEVTSKEHPRWNIWMEYRHDPLIQARSRSHQCVLA